MQKHPVKILVVEDSKTQALHLKHDLIKVGYDVTLAFDGREALGVLAKKSFDIIISDVIMPGMDGFELCRLIKSDSRLNKVAVVLLTALQEPEDIVKGLDSGADNFIVKPYDIEILTNRIEYILANRRIRESNGPEVKFEVMFAGKRYAISSQQMQIVDLLLSTFETILYKNRELERINKELKEALDKINQLQGMLPICSNCHKIRDDDGYWHQVEEYIKKYADVTFTHSLCPECLHKLYPEYAAKMDAKKKKKK